MKHELALKTYTITTKSPNKSNHVTEDILAFNAQCAKFIAVSHNIYHNQLTRDLIDSVEYAIHMVDSKPCFTIMELTAYYKSLVTYMTEHYFCKECDAEFKLMIELVAQLYKALQTDYTTRELLLNCTEPITMCYNLKNLETGQESLLGVTTYTEYVSQEHEKQLIDSCKTTHNVNPIGNILSFRNPKVVTDFVSQESVNNLVECLLRKESHTVEQFEQALEEYIYISMSNETNA